MLREFIESSSGLAPMRQGLGLGSAISILSGIAVLLGAKGAAAQYQDCPPDYSTCNSVEHCAVGNNNLGWEECNYRYEVVAIPTENGFSYKCKPKLTGCSCNTCP